MNDGGPAFPVFHGDGVYPQQGMSLRDYFALHGPEPSDEDVRRVMEREQRANPHNEPYHNLPKRRGPSEIRCALRYEFADAMLKAREES